MSDAMWIFLTTISYAVVFCTASRPDHGLCQLVQLMKQYCTHAGAIPTYNVTGVDVERGAPGPQGERGLPGFVNYSKVEEHLTAKMEEAKKRFDTKLTQHQSVMSQTISELEKKIGKSMHTESVEDGSIQNQPSSKRSDELMPRGCHEVQLANATNATGGVFDVYSGKTKIKVFCDLTTDGGGWTVFQRRLDGSQNFNKKWTKYVSGFGNLQKNFWLGLENIHLLTQDGVYELRIEMTNRKKKINKVGIAHYQTFYIDGSDENYKLHIGGKFNGTHVTSQLSYHNNMPFSTKDRDNKGWRKNCAKLLKGGWWFNECHSSSLNGVYGENAQIAAGHLGIFWSYFNNIKKTEMKFRKVYRL